MEWSLDGFCLGLVVKRALLLVLLIELEGVNIGLKGPCNADGLLKRLAAGKIGVEGPDPAGELNGVAEYL